MYGSPVIKYFFLQKLIIKMWYAVANSTSDIRPRTKNRVVNFWYTKSGVFRYFKKYILYNNVCFINYFLNILWNEFENSILNSKLKQVTFDGSF